MKITIRELRTLIREEIQNSKKLIREYSVFRNPEQLKAIKNPAEYFANGKDLEWGDTPPEEKNAIVNKLVKIHKYVTAGQHQKARKIMDYDLPEDVQDTLFSHYEHPKSSAIKDTRQIGKGGY